MKGEKYKERPGDEGIGEQGIGEIKKEMKEKIYFRKG